MPSARFPSNSLRQPKCDEWRGLCHLLFLSLSLNSTKYTKTQESTRTRVLSWLEASGKALVEDYYSFKYSLSLLGGNCIFPPHWHQVWPRDLLQPIGCDRSEVTCATSGQDSLWAGVLLSSSLPSPMRSERPQTETFPSARVPDTMRQRQSWPSMGDKPIFCYQCWDFRVTAWPTSSEG